MKFAHIVNQVRVPESSDLYTAQPITFETMRRAKAYAEEVADLEVDLLVCGYAEDSGLAGEGFIETSHLTQSLMDVGDFLKVRKLPLIKDILDKASQYSEADIIIYTNVDIGLQPYFYNKVANIIKEGFDSFAINRRTVLCDDGILCNIEALWSQVGEQHPGFDCFVFHKKDYEKYILGNACIGALYIGKILALNMIAHSHSFNVFKDEHLTFHIGDDRVWNNQVNHEYSAHNLVEMNNVLDHYEGVLNADVHPIVENSIRHRYDGYKWNEELSIRRKKRGWKWFVSKVKKTFKL